jgi:hypothetical protein
MSIHRHHSWRCVVAVLCAGMSIINACSAQQNSGKRLIFSDGFGHGFDTAVWAVEIEPLPGSTVYLQQGKLVLDTRGGVTVWLKKMLKGDIEIAYTRRVVMEGGPNDRVSDLNQFWMALDPRNKDLFSRQGKFEEYDSLRLYYVGVGGNSNTTTRFRKYTGTGERRLIQEYSDAGHLLQPGRVYRIRIIVKGDVIQFYVDDVCYFRFKDPEVLTEGYFGFRSTWSRQEVDDFTVYELE